MSTCSLRMGHAALWGTRMPDYKLVVTKRGRKYFSTGEGDLPTFTQAERMYWEFRTIFAKEEGYGVFLYDKKYTTTVSWQPVNI